MNVKVTIRRQEPATGPTGDCGQEGCGLLLTRLARAANRSLAVALDDLGLRAVQFAVLHRLAEGGPAAQGDLASSLRVHASNLVRVLDEMEAEGLVSRERDPGDRRRQLVVLTAAGAAVLRRAEAIAMQTELELLAPLTPAERRQLRGLLDRMATHACERSC